MKSKPFFPNGYYQGLFTPEHHAALANIINDYKHATSVFQSVRGIEDSLSLYFAKDNTAFDLSNWRKALSRTDYKRQRNASTQSTNMNEHIIPLIKQDTPQAQIDPEPHTLIIGARSPATAIVVSDYPYGRRLRCVMRYWLETKSQHGTRLVTQSNNPKRPGLVWNKPHAGTYTQGAVILRTDHNAHVKEIALTDFNLSTSTVEAANRSLQEVEEFERKFLAAFTDTDHQFIERTKSMITSALTRLQTPNDK